MSTKQIVIAFVCTFAFGLALGRYSLPAKVVTETKTVTIHDVQSTQDLHLLDKSVTTIAETIRKDGTVTKVTTIKKNVDTRSDKASQSEDLVSNDTKKEVTYDTRRVDISAMAEIDPFTRTPTLVYGGMIQYRFLGPLKAGFFGFANGNVGVILGLSF